MANVLHVVNNGALGGGVGTVLGYLTKPGLMSGYSHDTLTWHADDYGRWGHERIRKNGAEKTVSDEGLSDELGKYDILHVHSIPSYRVLEALDALRQQGRCPKIVDTCHSSLKKEVEAHVANTRGTSDADLVQRMIDEGMLTNPIRFAATYWGSAVYRQERIMTLADRVQHMSGNYLNDTVAEYNAHEVRGKHIVVYNGIEMIPKTKVVDRPQKKRILYSGRFAPEKGTDEFIESLPAILKAHPTAEVRLMGGDRGGWSVQAVKTRLFNLFKNQFGSEAPYYLNRVAFMGWIADPKKIDEQYDWCDFVVVPSKDESFCLAIAEALNHKRIPIMTNTSSLNELYLSHGVGLPIEPERRNGEGIANVVSAALGNIHEPWMENMAQQGRKLVAQRYSLDEVVRQQRKVYEEILNR